MFQPIVTYYIVSVRRPTSQLNLFKSPKVRWKQVSGVYSNMDRAIEEAKKIGGRVLSGHYKTGPVEFSFFVIDAVVVTFPENSEAVT